MDHWPARPARFQSPEARRPRKSRNGLVLATFQGPERGANDAESGARSREHPGSSPPEKASAAGSSSKRSRPIDRMTIKRKNKDEKIDAFCPLAEFIPRNAGPPFFDPVGPGPKAFSRDFLASFGARSGLVTSPRRPARQFRRDRPPAQPWIAMSRFCARHNESASSWGHIPDPGDLGCQRHRDPPVCRAR